MKTSTNWMKYLTAASLVALTACGGDSQTAGNKAASASVSAGPISGFGSILQNGRRYIVDDNTQVRIDDNPSSSDLLEVGEFVFITSSSIDDNGNPIADTVVQETMLKGSITALDAANQRFTSLGQTVQVQANTMIDTRFTAAAAQTDFGRLEIGDGVEVSGYIAADGIIIATYIGYEDNVSEPRVVGKVSNLNAESLTFQINGLEVDYNTASLSSLPGDMLANDVVVRVRGSLDGEILEASDVKGFSNGFDDLDDGFEAELKGVITEVTSSSQIAINGIAVSIRPGAEFEDGSAEQLIVGAIVEVEGIWSDGGILADEVEFEQEDNVRIDGQITAITATNMTLNEGTISALGLTLVSNSSTRYEDDSDADEDFFGLDDLAVNDYVELRGYQSGDTLVLTEVVREDIDLPLEVSLRGPVTGTTPNTSLTILGVEVNVSSSEFEDENDNNISASTFFSAITIGSTIVEVEGSYNGSTITAEEAELELED
ncbi:MAG: DUF5666 domain-containing protein [Alcanivoracaceae bacterium]|jgi:hypothetical protein|nr:DUF5666 domain-containing protein [Alcanivoracaceae bacterium]